MGVAAIEMVNTAMHWLQLVDRELLLFAVFWFMIGAADEFAIDICWIWLRLTGRGEVERITSAEAARPLLGPAVVLIPAWSEPQVIGTTVAHALRAWPQAELRIYVGCYRNDPATIAAAMTGVESDARIRVVVHDQDGPTTKADCLNRLYAALCADELRSGERVRAIVLHDAEDMVHPAGLAAIDRALEHSDFVQLPVRPELAGGPSWIAGHYADEFAEAHAKAMVVRGALDAALPAAGVGCGFARTILERLAAHRMAEGQIGPFAAECLTEDYELGLLVPRLGGRSRFLRMVDDEGALVATRSHFPAKLEAAVRQKTRWIHGIALQGWDRLGWTRRPVDLWMSLRDRRGPLTAMVLTAAYTLLAIEVVLMAADRLGWHEAPPLDGSLKLMITISFAALAWRALMRFAFTASAYGPGQGTFALLRIVCSNAITIMAGRRAIAAYLRALRSGHVTWEKTEHHTHPALLASSSVAS